MDTLSFQTAYASGPNHRDWVITLKTAYSKNITVEDWNMVVRQMTALDRQSLAMYDAINHILVTMPNLDAQFSALKNELQSDLDTFKAKLVKHLTELIPELQPMTVEEIEAIQI